MKNKLKQKDKKLVVFKRIFCFAAAFVVIILFSGCAKDPIVAYIMDGTSAGSDNYTVNIDFMEDKRFEEKHIDILLKSDTDNLTLTFKREFDEDTEITINEKDKWNSLTQLLKQKQGEEGEKYQNFDDRHDLTLVMKSEQDANLTIKVVSGDLKQTSDGGEMLVNMTDISKEFDLDLGKNLD